MGKTYRRDPLNNKKVWGKKTKNIGKLCKCERCQADRTFQGDKELSRMILKRPLFLNDYSEQS